MSKHPYSKLPDRAFWYRSISKNLDTNVLINRETKLLRQNDTVASAGSCFASNLIPYIESAGLEYIRTEMIPDTFSKLGENLGYANFSASYGNIYTSKQLLQLYQRALGEFNPVEDRWHIGGKVIDPFRPGLKFPARSDAEFEYLTSSHLAATRAAFESCDVFVFTLGLTEAWIHSNDEATYPTCPGTVAGRFDSSKYIFKNFSVSEVVDDMSIFIEKLRKFNSKVRFILSVSPVPLVATASGNHVLTATTFSKSVLRVAAEIVSKNFDNVTYFPAYEIITGPQAPKDFFEDDLRNVSKIGVEFVMETLISASELKSPKKPIVQETRQFENSIDLISKQITSMECDEILLDDSIKKQGLQP